MSTLASGDRRQSSRAGPVDCLDRPRCAGFLTQLLGMLVLATLVSGCGADKPTYPAARLEGSVTLDGKPIAEGNLQFVPRDAGQAPITRASIVEGQYVAEAVPLGKLRVLLSASQETGKMVTEYSTPRPQVINLIPEKYRAGIPIEVTGDNVNLNFALKSR
jgi:hypothetical protein